MDLIELHNRALDQTQALVGGVEASQMTLPSPCAEWDVRELLNHIVGGNRSYAGIARRNQRRRAPGEDMLAEDPVEAYRRSADDLKQAWSAPRLLEETLPSHLGEMPGRALLGIHLVEVVGHGWDLAKATGQQTRFDSEVVQAAMRVAQTVFENAPRGTLFDSPEEAGEEAPEIDRLAAFLGRRS
jgi:uncharacterized protein (TIGR03086 family)